MSGIDKVEKSIRRKLTLQDYKAEIPQEVKTAKHQKVKITVYLTQESIRKLNELCSKNVLENGKPDKSTLISDAVDLLYNHKENNKG